VGVGTSRAPEPARRVALITGANCGELHMCSIRLVRLVMLPGCAGRTRCCGGRRPRAGPAQGKPSVIMQLTGRPDHVVRHELVACGNAAPG
jgi:hypothetical protein